MTGIRTMRGKAGSTSAGSHAEKLSDPHHNQ
jgi:hypothetical protein